MNPRIRILNLLSIALGFAMACASSAHALESCKAKIAKDGAIQISAKDVSGVLEWGNVLGQEVNSFGNAGTCLDGDAATKCELGAVGSAQRITPPELCTVFLRDGASATCSAFLKGCTPGVRSVGSGAGFVAKSGDVMTGSLRAISIDTAFGVPGCGPGDVCAQSRLVSQFGGADITGDLQLHDGVRQGASNGGIVKGGLVISCNGGGSSIVRSFNTTGSGGSYTVLGTGDVGECQLTTPYTITNRYFSATGLGDGKVLVTVEQIGSNTLEIRRTQESLGVFSGDDGPVSIVIY